MTTKIIHIPAKDLQAGDELKTSDGFIKTGGTQPLAADRVGIYTPGGLLSVDADALITVRREVQS
jgi:hypothetical protein